MIVIVAIVLTLFSVICLIPMCKRFHNATTLKERLPYLLAFGFELFFIFRLWYANLCTVYNFVCTMWQTFLFCASVSLSQHCPKPPFDFTHNLLAYYFPLRFPIIFLWFYNLQLCQLINSTNIFVYFIQLRNHFKYDIL
jgi:hypothetical protein